MARGSSIQPLRAAALSIAYHRSRDTRQSRIVEAVFHARDDVEICHGRLHHDDVRAFLDVLTDLTQCFFDVGRIHLVRTPVANFGVEPRGIAEEGSIERGQCWPRRT